MPYYTNPEFRYRKLEKPADRMARQAEEGAKAWRDYLLQQQAIRDRMIAQRAARLARETRVAPQSASAHDRVSKQKPSSDCAA
jgi:hypothetical protein